MWALCKLCACAQQSSQSANPFVVGVDRKGNGQFHVALRVR